MLFMYLYIVHVQQKTSLKSYFLPDDVCIDDNFLYTTDTNLKISRFCTTQSVLSNDI